MMGKPAWVGLVGAIALAFICGGIYAFTEGSHVAEAQLDPTVGVDANPAGNTATHVATINSCISVNLDDVFYIDLVVEDATNLNSWDATFRFEESVLEVNSLNADDFFLGSDVWPFFECYPGECQVSNVDQGGAGHTGEGVLGRLQITAIGPGISKANLDLRLDGSLVSGVQLSDENGDPIGPLDGYGYFDGSILNAQIAVGEPCPGECQPGVDTDGDGFDDYVECYLPTDQNDDCTDEIGVHDAWPLDINIDKAVTVVGDVLSYSDKIGLSVDGDPILQRLDLNADGAITVVGDVLAFSDRIGASCT